MIKFYRKFEIEILLNMKKNLIELHSIKAKFFINLYLTSIILFTGFLSILSYRWIFLNKPYSYTNMGLILLVILINIGMYYYSFLGYLDTNNNELLLKKPFRKKERIIKLENINNIEKERLFITRRKHIKVNTYNKDKTDTLSYYILSSSLSSLFGSDDAEFLWKEVLKRKKELKNNK